MPYEPNERFDPSLIFRGISSAGESLGTGIAAAIAKRDKAEAQTAGSAIAYNTLKNAGLLSNDEQTAFNKGNANQRHAIIMEATPRLLQKFQTEKERNDQDYRNQRLQLERKMVEAQNYVSPYAQQPVWVTDRESGESYQAGVFDSQGTPRFFPYGGSRGTTQAFQPDEETAKVMRDSGYTWAPTSGNAGRWINTDANKPDLAPDGNPQFTPDGTGYISRGQVKPITQPMMSQRMLYESRNQGQTPSPTPAPSAAPRSIPPMQPNPDLLRNPFGSSEQGPGPSSTPSPSVAPQPAATQKVRVKDPSGKIGLIPADQLQAALAKGYSQVQ